MVQQSKNWIENVGKGSKMLCLIAKYWCRTVPMV